MAKKDPAPRSFAVRPASFGGADVRWRPGSPETHSLIAAALLQSTVSHTVRASLARDGWDQQRLALASGVQVHRLGRLLRGESWIGFADLAALGAALGLDLVAVAETLPRGATGWLRPGDLDGPRSDVHAPRAHADPRPAASSLTAPDGADPNDTEGEPS